MDFDTNKRTLFLIAFALILALVLLLKNSNSDLDRSSEKTIERVKADSSNNIEILYVDDDENLKDSSKVSDKKEVAKKPETVEAVANEEDEIVNYLKQKSLKNITVTKEKLADENYEIPRFSVYADIDKTEAAKLKDKTLPPSTPIIVKGAFNSGVPYTVAIDANIYTGAKDIVISNNEPDGTIEEIVNIKDSIVKDEEREIIAPPTIGGTVK